MSGEVAVAAAGGPVLALLGRLLLFGPGVAILKCKSHEHLFFFFGCTAACGSSQTRDGTLAAVPACAGDPQPTVPQGNSAKEKSDSCVNLFFF